MSLIDNLAAYWKFNENAGASTAVDELSATSNLTKNGSATFAVGKINNGTDLELGTSDYWECADNANLSITGDISFSFWIKIEQLPSTAGSQFQLIDKTNNYTTNTNSWTFGIGTDNKLGIFFTQSGGIAAGTYQNPATVNAIVDSGDVGNWVHIAIVNDISVGIKVYKNGSEVSIDYQGNAQTISSIKDANANFHIGCDHFGGSYASFFDGMIDEVGIWARALSDSEVSELYNSGAGLQYPFLTGPTAPTVQTNAVTDITTAGGRLNGEITDVGSENADYIGFVFDTVSHGEPGDVAPVSSDYAEYVTVPGDFGVESFSNNRSDLSPATTYYIRACAHNSAGWSYGSEVSFETESAPTFRFENIAGVEYDATDHKTIFAERLNEILNRLHDLDGLDPS
jgi:hypothetical protein